MCGIAGLFSFARGAHATSLGAIAQQMGDALATRGPDDHGVWVDETCGIALAHRRLSILDLSPEGHQPMLSASGRYAISFNGEIYNYRELRAQLDDPWRGTSDTEVLLAAIAAWGIEKTLAACNGMFAFALWDRQTRTLTLARDRMGEKPLYYGWVNDSLVFASEMKAFRALPDWSMHIDREALSFFMRHSYIPAPYSIDTRIRKLPPASYVSITAAQQQLEAKLYWSLAAMVQQSSTQRFTGDAHAAMDVLEARLKFAVGQRMVSDVPLGAFLSGGIDSSILVALMQAQSSQPVKTFTIGFHEPGFDEAPYARAVAQHLGTDHHEMYVSPREAAAVIPHLPTIYDEPFADASQIPTYLVSKFARGHVTVALSGDGGDEMFGGYNRHVHAPTLWNMLALMPRAVRKPLAQLMLALPAGIAPGRMHNLFHLAEKIAAPTREEFYRSICSTYDDPEGMVIGGSAARIAYAESPNLAYAEWMMLQDALTYFPGDILAKVDRASMAVSLEIRTPFTDPELMACAWQLPLAMKIHGGKGKWLLRQLLYRHVPKALIERPKAGFAVPIGSWLCGDLHDWAADLLAPETLGPQGYFHPASVQRLWNAHQSGQRDCTKPLWNVLMFQSWLQSAQG